MSLLERQQAREAAEKTKADALQTVPAEGSANGASTEAPPGTFVPALIPAAPGKPAMQPLVRNAAREELLHDIRVRMQTQVIGAFDTLLDIKPSETRSKIEGIVDRVISEN